MMSPENLDTSEGQAAAQTAQTITIPEWADVHLAGLWLDRAGRYAAMTWAYECAAENRADHWREHMADNLTRALAALGLRAVPLNEEAS